MGLLHFHFSFFLGGPDGFQERFSVILVTLWEPLGPSWVFLGSLERPWSGPCSPLGTILVIMLPSWDVLWRSRGSLDMSLSLSLIMLMPKSRKSELF